MRTWRLISLLSILALVLAACGSQGSSPSAEESEASRFWIGSDLPRSGPGRADGGRNAGLRRRSTVVEP